MHKNVNSFFREKSINAHLWWLLQLGKVQCLHSLHISMALWYQGQEQHQHNTQSSRQDFTAQAQKLLSAFTDPLATPGQGKAMSSSAGSVTAPGHSCHGDSEGQPQSFAHLGFIPCPHTQLAKTLGSASATPATEPAPVLHGHENLGQTKPTHGLTREMTHGNKAKKRDLGKTQSLLSPSETSRQPLPNGGS